MADENIDVTVELHDRLSRPARQASAAVEDLRDDVDDLDASLGDATDSQDDFDRSTRRSTRSTRDQSRETGRASRALGALRKVMDRLGGTATNTTRGVGRMRTMLALVTVAVVALTPLIFALGGAIVALGAAAYAAVAGLSPLVGTLGAIPALLAGLITAFAAVKIGFGNIGEVMKTITDPTKSIKEVREALETLPPAGQEFVLTLRDVKQATAGWRESIQQVMLPGFTDALRSLSKVFPQVEAGLIGAGGAMGDLVRQVGQMVSTWGPDLENIFSRNVRMIDNGLTPAILGALSIFKDLAITAGPLAERFATWLGRAATNMAELVAAGRESGRLEAFFNRAGDLAAAVKDTLGDLFMALYNIGVISGVMGDALGSSFADAMAEFRAWTESAEGQNSIRTFFEDAIGPTMELARMFLGLAQAMGGLVSNPTIEPLLKQLRTEVGPAIAEMFSAINNGAGSAALDIITGLATAISTLPFAPLTTVITAFGDAMMWIGQVMTDNPWIATLVSSLLAAKLAIFIVKKALMVLFGVVSKIVSVVQFLAPLLRFLFMSPIGWVILLVAGLVLLYKRSERFRNIVHAVLDAVIAFGKGAWDVIKSVAGAVWDFLVGAWNAVSGVVTTVFGVVWRVVSGVFKAIWTVVSTWFKLWRWGWEIAIGVALIVFKGIAAAARWLWTNGIQPVITWIRERFSALWGWLREVGSAVWRPIAAGARWLWGRISAVFTRVREFLGGIWDGIRDHAISTWDGLVTTLRPVIDRVRGFFRRLGDFIQGIWEGLGDGLSIALDGIRGIVNGIIGGINTAIDGANKVKIGDDIPHIPLLFTGGYAPVGGRAMVGEMGPEVFVPRIGTPSVVGAHGPEIRNFAVPGYVVPNPSTPAAVAAPVPSWVQARLADRPLAYAAAPSAASDGGGVPQGHGSADALLGPVPQVHIHLHGDGSQLTEADVKRAALQAYREAERIRRERS